MKDSVSTADSAVESFRGRPAPALLTYADTNNLGDEIQSIAVRQLLPGVDALVDRDSLAGFTPADGAPRRIVLNGWYSGAPENWPPSEYLEPLLISMHISGTPAYRSGLRARDVMLSEPLAEYLRHYGPVGARDFSTVRLLQRANIDCYFSGCVTLTFPPETEARDEELIVLNEAPPAVEAFIRGRTKKRVIHTSHSGFWERDTNRRLERARELLDLYARASCVVTSRLHCALPSIAMGTPALLLDVASDQYRFEGLRELLHHCSVEELLAGKAPLDPDQPSPPLDRHKDLAAAMKDRIGSFINAPGPAGLPRYPLTDRQRLEGARHVQQLLIQGIEVERRRSHRLWTASAKLQEAVKGMAGLDKDLALTEEQWKRLGEIAEVASEISKALAS
jgi:hypothetical protein